MFLWFDSEMVLFMIIDYVVLLLLNHREIIKTMPRRDIKREARREEKAVKAAALETVTTFFSFLFFPFWDVVFILLCLTFVLRFS